MAAVRFPKPEVVYLGHGLSYFIELAMSFAAFASLYGCVLVTTSAAKLLEDQEPEARIHGCMTLTVTKILVLICF